MKVSVIIPIFNAEKYLCETLDCFINQTERDIEIICVDDGSTDNTGSILDEYKKRDNRISVYHQTEPSDGAALARNMGITKAKGEYLLFADADDLFERNLVELTYDTAKKQDADIVLYDCFLYDGVKNIDKYTGRLVNRCIISKKESFCPKDYPNSLFQMYAGAPWNHIFRREFIEENNIRFQSVHIADDIGFVDVAYAVADKVAVLNKRLVHYRRNASGNQTSNYDKWPDVGYLPFIYIKKELEKRNLFDYFKVSFYRSFFDHSNFYLSQMKSVEHFEQLYYKLKNEIYDQIGFNSVSDDDLELGYRKRLRRLVNTCDSYTFLVNRNFDDFYGDINYHKDFSSDICKNRTIVLYGAGMFGRQIYCQLLDEPSVNVISWVDQDYLRLGSFIESPDTIKDKKFDHVYVAIISEQVFNSVKNYLINQGIEESKIIWIGEQ